MARLTLPVPMKQVTVFGCRSAMVAQAFVEFWPSGWKTTVANLPTDRGGRSYEAHCAKHFIYARQHNFG